MDHPTVKEGGAAASVRQVKRNSTSFRIIVEHQLSFATGGDVANSDFP
jgi:hypothetical protein